MLLERIFIGSVTIVFLALAYLFYRGFAKRKEIAKACGFSEKTVKINQIIRMASGLLLVILLILAFFAPTIQHRNEIAVFTAHVDFAVDESRSMAAEKVLGESNRLERAKKIAVQFAEAFPNLNVRIDGFTREVRSHLFWTPEYNDFFKTVNGVVNIEAVPTNGTDTGKTLRRMVNFFPKDSKSKIIILLSDGEDRAKSNDLAFALQDAVEKNVKIIAIGVGESEGAPIPIYSNSGKFLGYEKLNSSALITYLDEQSLEEIAQKTHGIYVREDNLEEAFDFLDQNLIQEKKEFFDEDSDLRKIFLVLSLIPLFFVIIKN